MSGLALDWTGGRSTPASYANRNMNTVALPFIPDLGMIIPNMGTKSRTALTPLTPAALADALFTPVQQRVLGWLFGQPGRRYQSGELIRLANSGTGAVHRLLTRLAQTGLVTVVQVGNQKHYQANPASPVFAELAGLIRKSVGLAFPLREALAPLAEKIAAAFVYGSVARGEEHAASDIDLMVITEALDYPALYEALQAAEAALGRRVNPTLMSPAEWRRKRGEADGFAARVASQPLLMLIGGDDAG